MTGRDAGRRGKDARCGALPDFDAHFQEHGDGIRLDAFDHLVEHRRAFLLVGDDGVGLAVGTQHDALAELIHGVDVVDPVPIDVAQQDLALHVAEVDARLLLKGGDLLFVRLFGALDDVFDGDVVIPLIELFLRHIVGAFGEQPLFERAVQIVHIPLGRLDVGVDCRAHGAFRIVGDVF